MVDKGDDFQQEDFDNFWRKMCCPWSLHVPSTYRHNSLAILNGVSDPIQGQTIPLSRNCNFPYYAIAVNLFLCKWQLRSVRGKKGGQKRVERMGSTLDKILVKKTADALWASNKQLFSLKFHGRSKTAV